MGDGSVWTVVMGWVMGVCGHFVVVMGWVMGVCGHFGFGWIGRGGRGGGAPSFSLLT